MATIALQGGQVGVASAAGPEFIKRSHHSDSVQVANIERKSDLDSYYAELGTKSERPANGGIYPLPKLEGSDIRMGQGGRVYLSELPTFKTEFRGKIAGLSKSNEVHSSLPGIYEDLYRTYPL